MSSGRILHFGHAASHAAATARADVLRARRGYRARDERTRDLLATKPVSAWLAVPRRGRLVATSLVGAAAAVSVAFATASNSAATAVGGGLAVRIVILVAVTAAATYAQYRDDQLRMGVLLATAIPFCWLWLLNGASAPVLYSLGLAVSGAAPAFFAYLVLAHPTGRLRDGAERRFLGWSAGLMIAVWIVGSAVQPDPVVKTPLVRCAPHCRANLLSVLPVHSAGAVLATSIIALWVILWFGVCYLLHRRLTSSSLPVRAAVLPVFYTVLGSASVLVAYLVALAANHHAADGLGVVYVATAAAVPIAIITGLASERLFMGEALADYVAQLARWPEADPESVMASSLGDPLIRIAYRRPATATYVDFGGQPTASPPANGPVVWVERGDSPSQVAAITYDAALFGQERFVQACGGAALMRLERSLLEADVKASSAELAASRQRLVDAAIVERQRIERDLHDGVQQHLVAVRVKLDMAAELVASDPDAAERALASVGGAVDEVMSEVRALGQGIYPWVLSRLGLGEALKSAALKALVPTTVWLDSLGRYPEAIEVAVYFCCLEALQNVAKHAGPDARATIRAWDDGRAVLFSVRDTGIGAVGHPPPGAGLTNMHARIEAVGGDVTVSFRAGRGTLVVGRVPIR